MSKEASTNETKGPVWSAAQVENLVEKLYTQIISGYRNIKRNNLVRALSDDMCTILHVTKCIGTPRQMLFAKGLSEFVLKSF